MGKRFEPPVNKGVILVTGGDGFIGRAVCAVLRAQGKPVVALDRTLASVPPADPACLAVACDIRDKDHVEQVFRQHAITTVVHLASLLNTASRENPLQATQVNVGGSLNVLEAVRASGVSRVVYGSSISVYGSQPGPGRRGVSETTPAAPEDLYGATKRYVEILGDAYRRRFGAWFVALRIASVVGPGAMNTSSPWRSEMFDKLALPEEADILFPYRGDEALPLVHVQDVANMIAHLVAAERISFPVYNSPSETWTLEELAGYIESLGGHVRVRLGQSSVSGIPSVVDGQRFMTEFGFSPTSLREHLRCAADG
jgi:nucleoside-diphosphate-sugar epimerase